MSMFWEMIFTYAKVFAVGGLMCALAQLLIIKTKLTPARILVIFLLIGVALEGFGIYKPINEFAQAGISVPIIGFGASLARGSIEMARQIGFVGAFAGGLVRTAFGVGVAVVASYLVTLIFSPRSK
ncbi:SpoVA/SpoVAEb family sporulation membrane protein [Pumilibacter intestinalis]|uniref:SpoVA/SpoVAEb family sporulation membrane protein n=1 Tax=Pumilibacter intestinalis TaxID=2941511 RepID=UPI0020401E10|nr:SpoVA/SpoVAEb family sporulation membrane protein [Pumilibacter intestinalis]